MSNSQDSNFDKATARPARELSAALFEYREEALSEFGAEVAAGTITAQDAIEIVDRAIMSAVNSYDARRELVEAAREAATEFEAWGDGDELVDPSIGIAKRLRTAIAAVEKAEAKQ